MAIKAGDRIPSMTLKVLGEDGGPKDIATDAIFKGRTVALFALPGAFTRTCSAKHLPGFIAHADAIRAKGVDAIVCLSVNDAFVMGAWGHMQGAGDKVMMLADGNADFTRAIGMEIDRRSAGMGIRSKRYAMIVTDGVVKRIDEEPDGAYGVSSAEAVLAAL